MFGIFILRLVMTKVTATVCVRVVMNILLQMDYSKLILWNNLNQLPCRSRMQNLLCNSVFE